MKNEVENCDSIGHKRIYNKFLVFQPLILLNYMLSLVSKKGPSSAIPTEFPLKILLNKYDTRILTFITALAKSFQFHSKSAQTP